MAQILPFASTAFDLLLVVVGFGFIIVIHELGHFVAARWAGIRVFAFAVGFGPAVFSFRKGMGWRRGSSEREYRTLLADRDVSIHDLPPTDISPTEYRLNWLPLGGYVKMLGQEDANPGATSHAPDSYQTCHPAKRLVVISAGVVANVILAALVFMLVFMVGLRTEPPRLGMVASDGPAATALPGDPEIVDAGLEPGDDVLRINGREARSFNDLMLASAMARPGKPIDVLVRRDGFDTPLAFEVVPQKSEATGLQGIGVAPAQSTQLYGDGGDIEGYKRVMRRIGLDTIPPGSTLELVRVGEGFAQDIDDSGVLARVFAESSGRPVTLTFDLDGTTHEATLEPRPVLQEALVPMPSGAKTTQTHLLGFTPVMTVSPLEETARGYQQGLRTGDVFARLGSLEFPSVASGIAEIRRNAGETMPIVVLRDGEQVELQVSVTGDGTIGFYPDQDLDSTLLALPPSGAELGEPVVDRPGVRVVTVGGRQVSSFADIRSALIAATEGAFAAESDAEIDLELLLPTAQGVDGERIEHSVRLPASEVASLHGLGYGPPPGLLSVFTPAEFTLKAEGPIDAVGVGLAETHRVMMMTYLTFARLFQGSVKVEHLKGPVGIAHLGTRVADRGLIWLLFFMALISVNLAVVNFLPLPIVDGGQFLFIIFEWIRGKPVPEAVQSIATVAGLLLIGAAFLVVTFNDIRNVFTGL
ncbi:MAG: site-2 protease family protein [Phycisphaera sp.]|nr:MAG: site-2 protease family protein [Phycisphaera sp.]